MNEILNTTASTILLIEIHFHEFFSPMKIVGLI